MTMQLVQRVELTSSQASLTFSNIPSDGTDLLIVYSIRTSRINVGGANDAIYVQFNGLTANFSCRLLQGTGSSVQSVTETRFAGYATMESATASTFGNSQIYIPNYTSSTAKSFQSEGVTENNATFSLQVIAASLWNSTAPISSILLESATASSLLAGSSATLYKITKGSDGTTTVS